MLNRLNRTLSANLNGLNLGTRSFAALANLNNGTPTLRLRHAHPQRVVSHVRDGSIGDPDASRISIPRDPMSMPPCSPSGSWWFLGSHQARARVEVVTETPPAVPLELPGVTVGGRAPGQPQGQGQPRSVKPGRKPQPKPGRRFRDSGLQERGAFAALGCARTTDRATFAPVAALASGG